MIILMLIIAIHSMESLYTPTSAGWVSDRMLPLSKDSEEWKLDLKIQENASFFLFFLACIGTWLNSWLYPGTIFLFMCALSKFHYTILTLCRRLQFIVTSRQDSSFSLQHSLIFYSFILRLYPSVVFDGSFCALRGSLQQLSLGQSQAQSPHCAYLAAGMGMECLHTMNQSRPLLSGADLGK